VGPALPVLLAALAVATCGLAYELLAATVASWVLGDSVRQFSTVIGLYLAALGLGAYASRFVRAELGRRFVQLELLVALVGGGTTPLLFLCFARAAYFRVALYAAVLACGTLVGLELPILLRIVNAREAFRDSVARVLAFDHAGSLAGSLLLSLVLLPSLGPLRAGLLFGLLNAAVALWSTWFLGDAPGGAVPGARGLRATAVVVLALLGLALWRSRALIDAVESGTYAVAPFQVQHGAGRGDARG
jgi:spermidine synthase